MLPSPTFTNLRSYATDIFHARRAAGQVTRLLAALTCTNIKLDAFPSQAQGQYTNRKYLGTQEILVGQVIGSLDRAADFDRQFHPLKKHLRERWVSLYLNIEAWPPIRVHKLGEQYYVEDGHHRLSVARAMGMAYIRAEVWEYPDSPCQEVCKPQARTIKKSSRVALPQP